MWRRTFTGVAQDLHRCGAGLQSCYATCHPSPRSEFISSTDRSISWLGSSTSSTDSDPSGLVMMTR